MELYFSILFRILILTFLFFPFRSSTHLFDFDSHPEWYRLPKLKKLGKHTPSVWTYFPDDKFHDDDDDDDATRFRSSRPEKTTTPSAFSYSAKRPPIIDPLRTQKLRFVRGSKGNLKMLLGGYAYFKNNCNTDRTYWLCSRNRKIKCGARIITRASTSEVMLKNQMHNHEPEYFGNGDEDDVMSFNVVDSVWCAVPVPAFDLCVLSSR